MAGLSYEVYRWRPGWFPSSGGQRMGMVHIEDVQPDMVLATDVRSRQGRLLFAKGTTLDDLDIQTLKFWGVTETEVHGHDQETLDRKRLAALDPAVVEAARTEAARRLQFCDPAAPFTVELNRVVLHRLAATGIPPLPPRPVAPAPEPNGRKRLDPSRLASGAVRLASLPDLVMEVLEALKNPNISFNYVAELIGRDVNLSAKLLKMVNSALYGFPEPVETISRAVTVVGAGRLTSLALGVSLITAFGPLPGQVLDLYAFWEHSLACGVIARLLAVASGHPNEERCFVAGLLHDIGRLLMLRAHPGPAAQASVLAWQQDKPICACEQEAWGFDHAALGGRLLTSWKFPASLQNVVESHHTPTQNNQDAALVHVADILAHALAMGRSGAPSAPPLVPAAWELLGLPPSVLGASAAQAESQLAEIGHIVLNNHDTRTKTH